MPDYWIVTVGAFNSSSCYFCKAEIRQVFTFGDNIVGLVWEKSYFIQFMKMILSTVTSIKPTGQDVAGLVTELISKPGICTSLVTVRDTVYSSTKLPGLSDSDIPGTPTSRSVATAATVTCRERRKEESLLGLPL